MSENAYPCEGCTRDCAGHDKACRKWRDYYLEHQEAINDYARVHGIRPICIEMTENPCKTCSNRYVCKTICPARAAWWDVCVGGAKRGWGE